MLMTGSLLCLHGLANSTGYMWELLSYAINENILYRFHIRFRSTRKMKSRADFDKIIDKHGKLIGVLNYNLMVPVTDEQIHRIDLGKMRTDTPADKHYKDLCINELTWCRRNQENIVNKANVPYSLCTEPSDYKGKDRCLDYKKMEKICDKYNSKKK